MSGIRRDSRRQPNIRRQRVVRRIAGLVVGVVLSAALPAQAGWTVSYECDGEVTGEGATHKFPAKITTPFGFVTGLTSVMPGYAKIGPEMTLKITPIFTWTSATKPPEEICYKETANAESIINFTQATWTKITAEVDDGLTHPTIVQPESSDTVKSVRSSGSRLTRIAVSDPCRTAGNSVWLKAIATAEGSQFGAVPRYVTLQYQAEPIDLQVRVRRCNSENAFQDNAYIASIGADNSIGVSNSDESMADVLIQTNQPEMAISIGDIFIEEGGKGSGGRSARYERNELVSTHTDINGNILVGKLYASDTLGTYKMRASTTEPGGAGRATIHEVWADTIPWHNDPFFKYGKPSKVRFMPMFGDPNAPSERENKNVTIKNHWMEVSVEEMKVRIWWQGEFQEVTLNADNSAYEEQLIGGLAGFSPPVALYQGGHPLADLYKAQGLYEIDMTVFYDKKRAVTAVTTKFEDVDVYQRKLKTPPPTP